MMIMTNTMRCVSERYDCRVILASRPYRYFVFFFCIAGVQGLDGETTSSEDTSNKTS